MPESVKTRRLVTVATVPFFRRLCSAVQTTVPSLEVPPTVVFHTGSVTPLVPAVVTRNSRP